MGNYFKQNFFRIITQTLFLTETIWNICASLLHQRKFLFKLESKVHTRGLVTTS